MAKFEIITYLVLGIIASYESRPVPPPHHERDVLEDAFVRLSPDTMVEISQNLALKSTIIGSIKAFKEQGMSAAKLKWDSVVKLGTITQKRPNAYDDIFKTIMYQIYDQKSILDILEYVKYAAPQLSSGLWGEYMTKFLQFGYAENLNIIKLFFYLDYALNSSIKNQLYSEKELTEMAEKITYYNTTKTLLNSKVCIKDFASGQYIVGFESEHDKNVKLSKDKDLDWGSWRFEVTNGTVAFLIRNVKDGQYLFSAKLGIKPVFKGKDTMESIWDINMDPTTQRFALAPIRANGDRYEKVIVVDNDIRAVVSFEQKHYDWVIEECEENMVKE